MALPTEKFEVRNRWTNAVQFTAEITCAPDATIGVKLGLAIRWAARRDNDADLSGAVLSGAVLPDWIPRIPDIHQRIFAAASADGALDMSAWHRTGCCGTTHCRAGHVVVQAGDGGRILEGVYGTAAAAAMIYAASDPSLECTPNFYASNAEALEDMKRLADLETARATPAP